MAEWTKAHAWRACMIARSSRVRIPVPPQRTKSVIFTLRAREESNLQPPGPQPGVLSFELRAQIVSNSI